MSGWRGLYLKTTREQAADALLRLAKSRGYSVVRVAEALDQDDLENVWAAGIEGRLDTLEVIFLLAVDSQWTRLIGLDFDAMALPRLFYTYELAMLLGCDGFECGFVDTIAWWYSYFEKGLIVDRFCSDPLEALHDFTDQIWGPDDPRIIYRQCAGIERLQDIRTLPIPVQRQLQGQPEKLIPILKPSHVQQLKDILQEWHPERAIDRLSQMVALPYIDEFTTVTFLEDFASVRMRGEPTPDWITEPLEQGLGLVMLRHPKYSLLGQNKD